MCSTSERFMQTVSTGPRPQRVPDPTVSVKLHVEEVAATYSHAAFTEYAMFKWN